jgi:multiple sugar transport system permease protein
MKSFLFHLALVSLATIFLFPFAWLLCAAFKTGPDLFNSTLLPWSHLDHLTLNNFKELLQREPFVRWLLNSIFLSSTYTVLVVTLSSLAGFALAKYQFPAKRPITALILATMLLPSQVLLPGSYDLMLKLHWIDSFLAILIPGSVSALGIFLFRQSMQTVPDELLQAARIDGCSELSLWWNIALPVVRPMIAAYTLLSFLSAWNSFLWPQIVLQSESKYTLPIALNNMLGLPEYQQQFGLLMAATLISILPVIILFFTLQKDFISGLATGAVKG